MTEQKIKFCLENDTDGNISYELEADNLSDAYAEALEILGYYVWWSIKEQEND